MKLKDLVFICTTPFVVFTVPHKGRTISFKRTDITLCTDPDFNKLLDSEVESFEVHNGRMAPYFKITLKEKYICKNRLLLRLTKN